MFVASISIVKLFSVTGIANLITFSRLQAERSNSFFFCKMKFIQLFAPQNKAKIM